MLPFINCDMGEGAGHDEALMPLIRAANIACGYHAGDAMIMDRTIARCIEFNVAIGAHPSFFDRENFGRTEMQLPASAIYDLVTQQLIILQEIASGYDKKIVHVKPHGALYNMSAANPQIAGAIARAVLDFDPALFLLGLSGSHSISEARRLGLKTASEVFADRSYRDDGSLTPRSAPGALLEDTGSVLQQVGQMVENGSVTTISGKTIPITAETICIHGDGAHAVEFAKTVFNFLTMNRNEANHPAWPYSS